jgi:hypothetical protein
MSNWIWITLIVLAIIMLIAAFLIYSFIYRLSNFFAPNPEIDSVNSLKRFLNFILAKTFLYSTTPPKTIIRTGLYHWFCPYQLNQWLN